VSGQPTDTGASATQAADAATALDLLLAAAALGPLRRLLPGRAGVRFATRLARQPRELAGQAIWLAGELARVGLGRSSLAPSSHDRRFTDPAWTSNPLLRRLVQAYLAAGQTAERLLADADLEWRDAERMRFVFDNLVQALAPSNNRSPARSSGRPWSTPAAAMSSAAPGTWPPTWPPRHGCRPWWPPTRSTSAPTWR
jgi:hypothetical protein